MHTLQEYFPSQFNFFINYLKIHKNPSQGIYKTLDVARICYIYKRENQTNCFGDEDGSVLFLKKNKKKEEVHMKRHTHIYLKRMVQVSCLINYRT